MKFFTRLIFSIVVNALAIWAAAYWVPRFIFQGNLIDWLTAALILTAINVFVRPLLKFLFGPLIVLTLGTFMFVINLITIYLLDKFSTTLTINGLVPLFWATVIISLINLLCSTLSTI